MSISEHELLTFERVKRELQKIDNGMSVDSTGPLAEELGRLGCFPYAKIPCDSFDLRCEISVGDKPAGTFEKPDVDLILQESTASSFGKGEATVLDTNYRDGKEIPAQSIDFLKHHYFLQTTESDISAVMFVGKTVKLKFYKLAVYQEGGHFDWHRDTTHNDKHHATLLLALNTTWEGGDLKLRRNGVETAVDMHPKPDRHGEGINLLAIAFYTDTEHKVEPVIKGIRIVLQYDVEVVGWERDGEDEFDTMAITSRKRKRHLKSSDSLAADDAIVKKVTTIIASLLEDGEEEVAFAMQYLYRKSSILPEFLKGVDAQLYHTLVSSFDVALRPVVLQAMTDYDGGPDLDSWMVNIWGQDSSTEVSSSPSESNNVESDAESDTGSEDNQYFMKENMKKGTFHLPKVSAIRQISRQDYIEHTGNEAQPGDKKYFGGGMFVRQKVAKKQ